MPNQHHPYTAAEKDWLRANYASARQADIEAALPTRTWTAIQNQAFRLKVTGRPLALAPVWTPERMAVLRQCYPAGGPAVVAALLGLTHNAVRERASRLKLAYEPPRAPVRIVLPRPSATAVPLLAVKQSTHTPNLNMAREARKRKEAARSAAPITSEEIRKLPANHPARHAYAMNGVAGWQQWKAAQ